jgi:hypothetical protein
MVFQGKIYLPVACHSVQKLLTPKGSHVIEQNNNVGSDPEGVACLHIFMI